MEIDLLVDVLSGAALHKLPSRMLEGAKAGRPSMPNPETKASRTLPPALLTMANYYGTLAAVRALGRAGIGVTTADPSRFAVSAWSRYTTSHIKSPGVRDTARFLEWLFAFGKKHGKHVLLPTNDDTAWLFSLHREELSRHFHLSSPPVDVIYRLLNKRNLYQEAVDAGLHVPRTWFPENADDLGTCIHEARFPVVVKPTTQVMFKTQSKGIYVEDADRLSTCYSALAVQPHGTTLIEIDPCAARPMVQEFYPKAATGIYSISGYAHKGKLVGVRAARKLLQQPRRLGTGVCFEEAPVIPELAAGLERLIARVGFSGIFEAEFIETPDRAVLIDFNPRFYNQMEFDIVRGLPLPLLAYYDALGCEVRLNEIRDGLSTGEQAGGRVFVDLIALRVLLSAQRLSGALSRAEMKKWTDWHQEHRNRDRCTYGVLDATDNRPFWFAAVQMALRSAAHPRNFVTSIVLNR